MERLVVSKGYLMRTLVALMMVCGWFVAHGAVREVGSAATNSSTRTVEPRVFNVLDYGARGDHATDNTAAFSACLKAVIAAGGGRM